jgi:hypothetical protein
VEAFEDGGLPCVPQTTVLWGTVERTFIPYTLSFGDLLCTEK